MGLDLIIVDKRCEKVNESEVMNIIGLVKERDVILVDDMIDIVGMICKAVLVLKE